jgi:apolipoprotein N-acyltransferase
MLDAFGIIGWLLSIVGVAGVVALFVFFPVAAAAFFSSTIGRIVIVVALVFLAFLGGRQTGTNAAMRKCEAAALRLKLQAAERDKKAAETAARDTEQALGESRERLKATEEKVDEYADALKKRPDAACLLTDDDIRWLRGPDDRKRTR